MVSQAGGVLLVGSVRKAGLHTAISAALTPWRKPRAVHDPGKILLDVALAVALGGDCLAAHWPWTDVITDALDRLHALPNPERRGRYGCPGSRTSTLGFRKRPRDRIRAHHPIGS
ncbi:hypothetical protein GCM10011578_096110 [Streptomyces fuscichromogenes]|uniref:Transposase DDE domain-containing protein n=1 Tax=Streptomyces fuscichromogenes TaxID=1324013 RepID=A0A918CXF5_9ACTN|nr:hypothetical protein GCM10011578_096110 [Streptomyces fuscichromogenes]